MDEDRDLNIIREKEQFMIKCRSWYGNKLKVGNSTAQKVKIVTENDADDADDVRTFVPDIPVDPLKKMPEQDVVDNNGK